MLSLPFLDDPPRFLFFTGKGGVGKTSLACAAADHPRPAGQAGPARQHRPRLERRAGLRPHASATPSPRCRPSPGLDALEIDPQQAADAYRDTHHRPGPRSAARRPRSPRCTEQLSGACTTEIASFNEFTALLADATAHDSGLRPRPLRHRPDRPHRPSAPAARVRGPTSCPTARATSRASGPLAGLDKQRHDLRRRSRRAADPTRTRLVLVTRPQRSPIARDRPHLRPNSRDIGLTHAHLVVNGVLPAMPSTGATVLEAAIHRRETVRPRRAAGDLGCAARTTRSNCRPINMVGVAGTRALLHADSAAADEPRRRVAEAARGADAGRCRGLVDELAAGGHGLVMCMGKGGVGKTTVAAAIALALAHARPRGAPDARPTRPHTCRHPAGGASTDLEVERIDPGRGHRAVSRRGSWPTRAAALDDAGPRRSRRGPQVPVHRRGRRLPAVLARRVPSSQAVRRPRHRTDRAHPAPARRHRLVPPRDHPPDERGHDTSSPR